MKIYLINMPFHEQEYIKFTEKWEYVEDEYIGIQIVQSILENEGCDVFVNDKKSIRDIVNDVNKIEPDIVMISVMQTSARLTYRFVNEVRKQGYCGKIFIGGWFAKMAWKEIFIHKWPVDFVCCTDAELSIKNWIHDTESDFSGIISYKNYNEYISGEKSISHNKDSLWNQNYVKPSRIEGRNTYCIEMSRGCPHSHCTFCSQSCGNYINGKWQPLPYDIIKKQIIELNTKYGITRFATTDDDLLGPLEGATKRAQELNTMIHSLPFDITFSASISVKAATNGDILDYLIDAGLEQLCIGFESADEEQLKRYCKQQSLDDNFKAAKEITTRNICMLPGLITFDPFATPKTIEKNLHFLFYELKHYDLAKLTKKLHLLTGSPMVKMVKDAGLLKGDYLYYDYDFQDKDVENMYIEFNEYTNMVKILQKEINKKGKYTDKNIGKHHMNIAEQILLKIDWRQYACKEIEQIKNEL